MSSFFKLSILNLILAILLMLNIFIFHSPILGVILGLGFIVLSSYLLGILFSGKNAPRLPAGLEGRVPTMLFGFILFLCIVILALTIIYYFYQLDNWIIAGFLILLSIILLIVSKYFRVVSRSYSRSFAIKTLAPCLIYLILLILSYFILKTGLTMEPVRTPWHFVSKWFFVSYFLSTAVLIYLIRRLKTVYALILSSLHLFFTFSIANIIFPLGFGYDPFIHQATEKYILDHNFILPKKPYYLGQYVLVYFLTKISQISHIVLDKNLVPALAAILLPSTIYYSFKKLKSLITHYSPVRRSLGGGGLLITFIFLIIPFTILTFTTPQNLGDLLVIILAFLGLSFLINNQQPTINNRFLFLMVLMALTVLMIHPLAGLAAIIFTLVLWTSKCKVWSWLKKVFYIFLCFSIFCVFLFFSFISPLYKVDIVNNFNLINFYNNLFRWSPDLFLNTNFVHLIKTIAYFFYQPMVLFIIIFLLAIYGLYTLRKKLFIIHYSLFITSIILFINSFIIFSFLKFGFLIHYEQGDFSWRIFNLGVYFLIPLALLGAWKIISVHWRINWRKLAIIILIFIISAGITTSLYFSYPRQDIYYYTRGFNTSIYDFNAIKYLEEITNEDYVVLANQQIGAGALTTFGFRYFENLSRGKALRDQHFFYSIPTGSELYKIYWNIVYEDAGRDEIKKASELTGAKIIYVYFPDYWFNLKKLSTKLIYEADETMVLENGKVWVFKFSY